MPQMALDAVAEDAPAELVLVLVLVLQQTPGPGQQSTGSAGIMLESCECMASRGVRDWISRERLLES